MKLKIDHLVAELNDALDGTSLFSSDSIYISGLIYEIETELTKIKRELKLDSYNPHIYSKRITESFGKAGTGILTVLGKPNAYTSVDYQYYLLIFLLRNYHELITLKLSLHQIIDRFIDLHKENSLIFYDIQLTDSGATRCRTNIRFAFDGLKVMGLLKLYNREQKEKSWMLTYLGLIVATSIMQRPDPDRPIGINDQMRGGWGGFRAREDLWIFQRIRDLTNLDFYKSVIDRLTPFFTDTAVVNRGFEAIREYNSFLEELAYRKSKSDIKTDEPKMIREFLKDLEKRHSLDDFMKELSLSFESELFMKRVNDLLRW